MSAINETNGLYFYPHTLRFEPFSSHADDDRNGRWLDGHYVSGAASRLPARTSADVPHAASVPEDARGDHDDEHPDDDGAHAAPPESHDP